MRAARDAAHRSGDRFCLTGGGPLAVNPAMPPEERPPDPTPIVGAATDVSPLTHRGPKPPHERSAAEEAGAIDWAKIAGSQQFRALLKAKARFVIPAMIIFIAYYFALPILVGYARPLMEKEVLGPVNLAYFFALSQFFMAWLIAGLYVRAASRFDRQAKGIINKERT